MKRHLFRQTLFTKISSERNVNIVGYRTTWIVNMLACQLDHAKEVLDQCQRGD